MEVSSAVPRLEILMEFKRLITYSSDNGVSIIPPFEALYVGQSCDVGPCPTRDSGGRSEARSIGPVAL